MVYAKAGFVNTAMSGSPMSRLSLGRILAIWFGCFLAVGLFLFLHFGVPLLPLLLAGAATFLVTLGRALAGRNRTNRL